MKWLITSILLISLKANAVDLGPFKVTQAFCQDINKVGSILNAFQINQWTVAGPPAVVIGLTQRSSPVMDLCNFMTILRNADTAEAILMSGEKLNTIMKTGMDEELKLTRDTWRLANSQYDFNRGQRRAASMDAAYTADKLGRYALKVRKYNEKREKKENEERERQENSQQINELAKLSKERAVLKEALTCPGGRKTDTDFYKVYENELEPLFKEKANLEIDVNFLIGRIKEMGPKFLRKFKDYKEYDTMTDGLMTDGVTYDFSERRRTEETTVKTGALNDKGEAVTKKETINKPYQVWSVKTNSELFFKFGSKWSSKYMNYVMDYAYDVRLSEEGKAKFYNEFKALSYECNPARIGRGLDPENPEDRGRISDQIAQCNANIIMDKKKAMSLLSYYVDELQKTLTKFKGVQAKLWTLESKYLGRNRIVSTGMTATVKEETVSCSDSLSPAAMQELALKQDAVNTQLNENLAQESYKQTMILEEQKRKEDAAEQERIIQQDIVNKQLEEDKRGSERIPRAGSY